jgi:hypothetical protein
MGYGGGDFTTAPWEPYNIDEDFSTDAGLTALHLGRLKRLQATLD